MSFARKITKTAARAIYGAAGSLPVVSQVAASNVSQHLSEKQASFLREEISREIERINHYGFDIREINEILEFMLTLNSSIYNFNTEEQCKKFNKMGFMLHQSGSNLLFFYHNPELIGSGNAMTIEMVNECRSIAKSVIEAEIQSNDMALKLIYAADSSINNNNAQPTPPSLSSTSAIHSVMGSSPTVSSTTATNDNRASAVSEETKRTEDDLLAQQDKKNDESNVAAVATGLKKAN